MRKKQTTLTGHGHSTLYIDSCTDILYNCTQLVNINFASVYTTHINMTNTHIDITLYLYILLKCRLWRSEYSLLTFVELNWAATNLFVKLLTHTFIL